MGMSESNSASTGYPLSPERGTFTPEINSIEMRSTRLRGVRNAVPQLADAGDRDSHLVAGLQPDRRRSQEPDAVGCSGGDHVSRPKDSETGDIGDQVGDIEYQITHLPMLHLRPVHVCPHLQRSRIADNGRRGNVRPEAAGGLKVLPDRQGMLHLKIAQAAIVVARIAEDMIEGGVRRDIASRLADDDRKLALEIELVRGARANKRPAMRHNGIEHPDEQAGKFGQLQAG